MSSSTDESNTNALPDPELNPLLNPLLAQHMGRWAEVYFTNPPEKRAEAIAELLRELEGNATPGIAPTLGGDPKQGDTKPAEVKTSAETQLSTAASKSWISDSGFESSATETYTGKASPRETPTLEIPVLKRATFETSALHSSMSEAPAAQTSPDAEITCAVCAYVNPPGQFFCGMCGGRLESVPTKATEIVPSPIIASPNMISASALATKVEVPADRSPAQENYVSGFDLEPEPEPKSYRFYAGIAVAILFLLLVYMAWRGTRAFSTAPKPATAAESAAPAAASPTQIGPSAAPPSSADSKGDIPSPTKAPSPAVPAKTVSQAPAKKPTPVASRNHTEDSPPANTAVTGVAGPSPIAPEQSGAVELAMAEKYLNGDADGSRNAFGAVPWLWKAVGKGNVQAAMTLSDLYLRGDGVAKNCDQARVLLDSAARKGEKAAADRLRNLQSFGCR